MEVSVRGTPIEITKGTIVLILVGLALITYGGYDYVQQSAAVDDAVTVEATVSEIAVYQSEGRSTDYHVQTEFTYQYQGTEYTSDQLFPGDISQSYDTESEAESAIEPYAEGETATAYVDPADPSNGFLERQTTQGPTVFMAIGGGVLLVTALNAIGARKPGQDTKLRPVSEDETTRYRTLLGIDRDTVNRISKRLITASLIAMLLSLMGTVILLLVSNTGSQVQVGLSDPIGLLFGTALLAVLVLLASISLYAVWSFTEYRRLRDRIPEPRPPSPFKHPTRLVTILLGNHDLDDYGKRVQRTGFVLLLLVIFLGAIIRFAVF